MMNDIAREFTADHEKCDAEFAALEGAVSREDWPRAAQHLERFCADMRRHLDTEEQSVFPGIEAHTGSGAGPVAVMRMEHDQMRELLEGLEAAVHARDGGEVLGIADTLLVLMQQHNIKEEQILYALADDLLDEAARGEAIGRLR
jgi:iron-sulfur cluster repair protein YtfE (RIC family)